MIIHLLDLFIQIIILILIKKIPIYLYLYFINFIFQSIFTLSMTKPKYMIDAKGIEEDKFLPINFGLLQKMIMTYYSS